MVLVEIVKKYSDVELERTIQVGEKLEVSVERAKKLASMGLASIIKIDKLNKKEYGELTGRKKR